MPLPSPRVYPVAFAREILDSVEAMKASTHGQPALPNPLPTAFETFTTMKWSTDDDIWGFVDFAQLFNYIRNNRSLRIPSEWKAVVPKTMWPAFKTCTIMYQTFVYPNSLLVYIASMMLEWFRSQWLPAFQVELYAFTWFYVIFLEKSSGLPRTRTKPVLTRTISRKTPGLSQYLGYPQPVPNPYQTRTLPVLTRTFSMGLDGSDFSNFSYVYDWVFSIIKIENPFPGCTQLWDRFVCENIIQVDSDS